jgi:hypothetical protein
MGVLGVLGVLGGVGNGQVVVTVVGVRVQFQIKISCSTNLLAKLLAGDDVPLRRQKNELLDLIDRNTMHSSDRFFNGGRTIE